MTELEILIENLEEKIKKKDESLSVIENPKMLLKSLQKLQNIIGMKVLKTAIAQQTKYLIAKMEEGKNSMKMLNTILYGDPGVGKTTVGVILAEIWCHLGLLKKTFDENKDNTTILVNQVNNNPEYVQIGLLASVILWGWFLAAAKWCYKNYGMFILGIAILVLLTTALITWIYYTSDENTTTVEVKNHSKDVDDKIIKIVSRSDFVGQYVGWTAKKTEALLNANRGKVLFIDECYSLCQDARDTFGIEALTSINKFMSEHPGEIVIIFAGYEKLMKQGIFTFQPGLPRRCMWQISCDNYTGEELFAIFEIQLEKEELKIQKDDRKKVEEYIVENIDAFPSFGGDTERLVFFSQIHQAGRNNRRVGYITFEDVKDGIQKLVSNNITKRKNDEAYNNAKMINSVLRANSQLY